jgi:hypothetical protein
METARQVASLGPRFAFSPVTFSENGANSLSEHHGSGMSGKNPDNNAAVSCASHGNFREWSCFATAPRIVPAGLEGQQASKDGAYSECDEKQPLPA